MSNHLFKGFGYYQGVVNTEHGLNAQKFGFVGWSYFSVLTYTMCIRAYKSIYPI